MTKLSREMIAPPKEFENVAECPALWVGCFAFLPVDHVQRDIPTGVNEKEVTDENL
jgi:hypothetical protein